MCHLCVPVHVHPLQRTSLGSLLGENQRQACGVPVTAAMPPALRGPQPTLGSCLVPGPALGRQRPASPVFGRAPSPSRVGPNQSPQGSELETRVSTTRGGVVTVCDIKGKVCPDCDAGETGPWTQVGGPGRLRTLLAEAPARSETAPRGESGASPRKVYTQSLGNQGPDKPLGGSGQRQEEPLTRKEQRAVDP